MKTTLRFVLVALALCNLQLFAADTTPPGVLSITPAPGSTVSNFTQITVVFDEPVVGVVNWNILVNGLDSASVANVGSTNFTFTFSQPAAGVVSAKWDPDQEITDTAGNAFVPGAAWQYTVVDTIAPTILSVAPQVGATVTRLTQASVTFSEPVLGVDASDLLINGTPATSVSGSGAGPYLFEFPEPGDPGSVDFWWAPGHGITDVFTNAFGGVGWNVVLDPAAVPTVRINEFMASAISTNIIKDEWGEAQDWIELYNYGTNAVSLGGYSLTDDATDPGRWIFPALSLNPGQYLVVFASGKDRRVVGGTNRLHTNFKLSSFNGYLGLFNAELPRVSITEFAPNFPEQRNDYSYGLTSSNVWRYFLTPTPGATNGNSTIFEALAPVHFSVERGLFDAPFVLYLTPPSPEAGIRYTIDGSEPTQLNGLTYTNALQISNITVLRAAAFSSNKLPSLTKTHTYVFPSLVLVQSNTPPGYPVGSTAWSNFPSDYEMDPEIVTNAAYGPMMQPALKALPSLSIVIKVDDMFGSANGIYTHPEPNADQRYLWERPCSVELMNPNGDKGFQIDCGIRMQGNASRNAEKTPKHPFRLMFKGKYGAGNLEYPIYPDSSVTSFDTLVLRADFNNSWVHWESAQRLRGTRMRDAWTKDTFREMGQPSGHSRHFHLYINGLYWGVYDFGERIDANFAASYLGGKAEEWDAIASKPTEAIDGDRVAYDTMRNFIVNNSMGVLSNYSIAQQLLDLPNFIDYTLLNFYGANQDWGADGNWNAIHRRAPGEKYKYTAWDGERLIEGTGDNRCSAGNIDLPSNLHPSLINSPEYRLAFADRVQKHLFNGGALTTNAVIQRWMKRVQQLETAIVAESARWGDYRRDVAQYSSGPYLLYTRNDHWLPEAYRMVTNYFLVRPSNFFNQLSAAGLWPAVPAPVLSQHGGRVARGFTVTMTGTATIYYATNGSDPRVFGSGAVSSSALLYTNQNITIDSAVVIKARVLNGTTWSPIIEATFTIGDVLPPLRVTEIMYNPVGGDNFEFIELQNISAVPLDIGGYYFDGITYQFPVGTILNAGQRIVLGSNNDTNAWKLRYPGVSVAGWFGGKLSNSGEPIRIFNASNQVMLLVDYKPASGWPTLANGAGYSLEIIDPNGDPNNPGNWQASAALGGTAGFAPVLRPASTVVINEFMAENLSAVPNEGTLPDWIELYNSGSTSADLLGWSLTDDASPRKFVFTNSTVIAPGGYLVVWCDSATNATPGWHTDFALDKDGQTLSLYNSTTNLADTIAFGSQVGDYSLGRVDGQWQLTLPTPNEGNVAAQLLPASGLVINEWMANAIKGGADWLELYNPSNTPVALQNLYIGTSNALCQIKSYSFIASGGYVQLLADESSAPRHLNLKFPAEGGFIVLYDEIGTQIDRVVYGPQAEGVSQGRLPDGWVRITQFPGSASPAAPNYQVSLVGPVLNEVLAKHYRAVTNSAGHVADWVELYNSSSTNCYLSGWSLSIDKAEPAQWIFPPGTVLEAQSYLVVWCDDTAPATTGTNASGYFNTGKAINAESGSVYLFNSARQLVDSIEFGFQVEDKSIGRSGDSWQLLASPTAGAANSDAALLGNPANLRINEWMAAPVSGDDWFELYNLDTLPVRLTGLYLADDPSIVGRTNFTILPLSFIGGNGFVKYVADSSPSKGREHVNFNLDVQGESLSLYETNLGLIDRVNFGLQPLNVSQGRLPDGGGTLVSFSGTPTPAESNYQPLPNAVITEVLSRAVAPGENAIEIQNPDSAPVPVGGWFLSNNERNFKKYRLPNSTVLQPGGYLVVYESQLNSTSAATPFTLGNPQGAQLWLSQADGSGTLTGYRARASFGPAETDTSFGRFQTSVGVDFTALTQTTLGVGNAAPKVGPVVINEIMYHPPDVVGNDDSTNEFIEIYNLGSSPVALYDPSYPSNGWRLQGGVEYAFTNVTIPAGGYLLVVNFDPRANPAQLALFQSRYGIPGFTNIYGPYSGKLDNGGEELILAKPGTPTVLPPAPETYVPYIVVDRVVYGDSTPWSSLADGNTNGVGMSLQRRVAAGYGNEPLNWLAAAPTAGAANTSSGTPPVIVQAPQNVQTPSGASASFSVLTTGDAPLSYLWLFNGVPILEATNSTLALYNVQAAQEGTYSVFVAGPGGTVRSSSAALSIVSSPRIILPPQTQGAAPGSSVMFAVYATGGGLSYQWRFNGADLPDATNATLTIPNVQPSDAGPYSVSISNALGAVLGDVAYLVTVAPMITSSPVGTTNVQGATVSLSVAATGDFPLTYQWRKNGLPIYGATSPSCIINNAQATESGLYDVLVVNAAGSAVSAGARVGIYVPVQVTQQPAAVVMKGSSLSASYGQTSSNATFSVANVGSTPLAYAWLRNGLPIPGATGPSFTVTNVTLADEGLYSVVISNVYSAVTSAPAPLIVSVYPAIRLQPPQLTVVTGSTVALPVIAVGNPMPMGYRWKKDGAPVSPNGFVLTNSTDVTLTLSRVTSANSGGYTVTVTNSYSDNKGPISANGYLTVVVPPASRYVQPGSNVTLAVTANCGTSTSKLRYQWQWNGTNLPDMTNTTLLLTNVQAAQEGVYSVIINNPVNYAATFSADLFLYSSPPRIVRQPQNTTVIAGAAAFFDVLAGGPGPLRYQWQLNGVNLPNATNANLALSNVQPSDQGAYAVLVSNTNGFAMSLPATLAIGTPPSIVTQPASQTADPGATVSFSVVADGTAPLFYQWQFNGISIANETNAALTLSGVQLTGQGNYVVIITNLLGAVTSSPASLSLNLSLPSIATHPVSQTVTQGATVLLSVVADGVPPLSYQWRHNGSDLFGANGPTLSLPNVQPPDEGTYAVVVSNASGSVTSAPALLTIQSPPIIAAHPLAQVVTPGESATFTIFAGGSLPLHYQWALNGLSIPGATNDSYVCPNAFYTNAGSYVVTVSNDAGTAQSEPAELTVRPRFISQTVNNGVFTLSYEGTVGKSYQLEASTTLTNWTSLQVLSNATIQVQFQNTNVLGGSNALYRLRQAP